MGKNPIIIHGKHAELLITRKNGEVVRVLIDSEDIERISHIRWGLGTDNRRRTSNKYVYGVLKNKRMSLHRLIFSPTSKTGYEIDHINKDTLDNRKANLRYVHRSINARNHRLLSTNSSGYDGVFMISPENWMAHIKVFGKSHSVRGLKTLEEAIAARKQLEEKYWGEIHERS